MLWEHVVVGLPVCRETITVSRTGLECLTVVGESPVGEDGGCFVDVFPE